MLPIATCEVGGGIRAITCVHNSMDGVHGQFGGQEVHIRGYSVCFSHVDCWGPPNLVGWVLVLLFHATQ